MSITIGIVTGIILTIIFHFLGIYTKSIKIVWIVIIILWAFVLNVALSEIKEVGYKKIEKMKGKFPQTDALIKDAMPKVKVYEMFEIQKSFYMNKNKK